MKKIIYLLFPKTQVRSGELLILFHWFPKTLVNTMIILMAGSFTIVETWKPPRSPTMGLIYYSVSPCEGWPLTAIWKPSHSDHNKDFIIAVAFCWQQSLRGTDTRSGNLFYQYIPILQMRKWRFREAESFVQNPVALTWKDVHEVLNFESSL